jgi:hypothetical protein
MDGFKFDHIAWRSERANIHDKDRPVGIESLSEQPGTLTLIGRSPDQRQAFDQVVAEAKRQGLTQDGLPDRTDFSQGGDRFDHWCAATWVA